MIMESYFDEFLAYLESEKNISKLTAVSYSTDFRLFTFFLNREGIEPDVNAIAIQHLRKYISFLRREKKFKNETIRRRIHSLKSFFNFLASQQYITVNPAMGIHAPKSEERLPICMTVEEIRRIIAAPMKFKEEHALRDKCILEMLAMTGMRRGELHDLNWSNIDFDQNIVTVFGKGKKERIIPIQEPLLTDLWLYLQSLLPLRDQAVFHSEKGTRLSLTPINAMFHKYLKKLGLEGKGYTLHKFRHSYATLLLNEGVDIISIQKLLGHSDLNSTKIYTHVSVQKLKSDVSKLPFFFAEDEGGMNP